MHGQRYLDLHDVSERTGLSTKTIRRKVRDGSFPPPFRFSGGFNWLESIVDAWLIETAIKNTIRPEEMPEPRKAPTKPRKSAEDR